MATVVRAALARVRRAFLRAARGVRPGFGARVCVYHRLRAVPHRPRQRRRRVSSFSASGRRAGFRRTVAPALDGVFGGLRFSAVSRRHFRAAHGRRGNGGYAGNMVVPHRVRVFIHRWGVGGRGGGRQHVAGRRRERRGVRRLRRDVRVFRDKRRIRMESNRSRVPVVADVSVRLSTWVDRGLAHAGRGARGEQPGALRGVHDGRGDGVLRRRAAVRVEGPTGQKKKRRDGTRDRDPDLRAKKSCV